MAGGGAKNTSTTANTRKKKEVKKETGLGLSAKKDDNFGEWYSEVVVAGELIEYYDISGCYILRPWTMSIWEVMQMGVMVMVLGDDKGLVLPPKVATVQVIVIPIPYKDADTKGIFDACDATVETLTKSGFRAEADFRDNYSPGWKYSHWEMKGVPLRIEIGPKDLANEQVRAVRRDNSAKIDIPMASLVEQVKDMLANIQQSLFDVAKQNRDACIQVAKTWDEFVEALGNKKMILAPWCDEEEVEKDVKARTKGEIGAAKTLCSPFEQPALDEGTLCFASGKPAKKSGGAVTDYHAWLCYSLSVFLQLLHVYD